MSAVETLAYEVENFALVVPALIDQCTAPDASDMAELLASVREARERLQQVERDLETATAKAMIGDQIITPTMRVERSRAADRKAWDHAGWQSDARAKVLRARGLLGAVAVITADGEELPVSELHAALSDLQSVHGSAAPRLTQLRGLGLDPDDYCERSPGRWAVRVQRLADETEGAA